VLSLQDRERREKSRQEKEQDRVFAQTEAQQLDRDEEKR
jgi:hypothetical protein